MPRIQAYPLLHLLLSFLKSLKVVGHKLCKLWIRQVAFLRFFFRKRLSLFIRRFRNNLNQMSKSTGSRPSMPWEQANHDDVDCFSRLPISFLNRWQQKSESLPLHHTEKRYELVPQTGPSTSQVVVPDSTTPTGDVIIPLHHTERCYPPESQTGRSTSQAVVPYSTMPTGDVLVLPHHTEHRYQPVPQTGPSTSQLVVSDSTTPTGDVLVPPHHTEHCYPPELQTGPSTSEGVVNYPITPMDDTSISSLPNPRVPTSAEDDCNRDLQSPPGLCKEISKLIAVTSSEFQRYERDFKSDKICCDSFPIRPLLMTFTEPELPNQWVTFTHPNGAPYFLDDSRKIPVLTDVWIYDADPKTKLETYIEQIFSYIEKYNIEIPEETCLVLEFRNSGRCGYYFVNHAKQCLFWLDVCNGMDFLGEVKVEYTLSHIGHEMKSLYWLHNYLFPNSCPLPSSAISEIKDILIHAVGNSLTSSRGLAPYSLEILQKMLDLVNTIEAQDYELAAGSVAIISHFLRTFHHERFLHLHGQINARLTRGQSIHPQVPERQKSFVPRLCARMFYFGKLHETMVDGLANDFVWKDLLKQLRVDWRDLTLIATVLLTSNVTFLATPAGNFPIFTYLSTMFSVAAMIFGLLWVKLHHKSLDVTFIVNCGASKYGLEMLALMYSLPYILLNFALFFFIMSLWIIGQESIAIWTTEAMFYTILGFCVFSLDRWRPSEDSAKEESSRS
ncbi:hypothetical protein BYT27DRAFT_6959625 [Phlegmacium glaucopus]|nr:hypothetical protein BYT27DRAFT_6959625 [Phlegmacium glaucopus]